MKYVTLIRFRDIDDDGHVYEAGEEYPRAGYKPKAARIKALLTDGNKVKAPVIKDAEEPDDSENPKTPEPPQEPDDSAELEK